MSKFIELKVDILVFLYLSFKENFDQVEMSFLRKICTLLTTQFNVKNSSLTRLLSSINSFVRLTLF